MSEDANAPNATDPTRIDIDCQGGESHMTFTTGAPQELQSIGHERAREYLNGLRE